MQEDPRLATFDEFLSEHWDISIVLGYLQANNLSMQAASVPCVDYPVRGTEPNAQPFICLRKANFIAEAVLGLRNEKSRERFTQVNSKDSVHTALIRGVSHSWHDPIGDVVPRGARGSLKKPDSPCVTNA